MAPLALSPLLPQCSSCARRLARLSLDVWKPVQHRQTRSISKAVRQANRNVVVKLLKDVPRFGRKGSYIPIAPGQMRNQWFPRRLADYVPKDELKRMKAAGVTIARDPDFARGAGSLVEVDQGHDGDVVQSQQQYVRPIEIDLLKPGRSMELLTTFVPPTIDFFRQPITQDVEAPGLGASGAADILTAAAEAAKAASTDGLDSSHAGIYGSVSTADIAATVKSALAHNDEAARVILADSDVRLVEGFSEGDSTRIKQLGSFKIELRVPGAEQALRRTVRIRAKEA